MASIRQHSNASPLSKMLVDAHIQMMEEFKDHKLNACQLFQLFQLLTIPLGMAGGHQRSGDSNGKLTLQALFKCCSLKK